MKTFDQFITEAHFDVETYMKRLAKPVFGMGTRKTKEDEEAIYFTFAAKAPRGWYKKMIAEINKCPMAKITVQDDHYQEVDFEVEGCKVTVKKYSYGIGAVVFKR
ncbi:hypothetical protein VPHD479_0296 [Vibrio phage D479]